MPPRTADRNITTCRNCRRRKIRCTRERPTCDRCTESDDACVYEDMIPRQAKKYRFVTETPGNALREAFPETISKNHTSATVPIPSKRLHSIKARVENLSEMIRAVQAQNPTGSGSLKTQVPTPGAQDPTSSGTSSGFSAAQGNDPRYVDLAFLTSMCDEVAELGELLHSQARYLMGSEQPSPTEAEPQSEYQASPDNRRPALLPGHSSAPCSLQSPTDAQSMPFTPYVPEGSTMVWDPKSDAVLEHTDIDWAYFEQALYESGYQEPEPSGRR